MKYADKLKYPRWQSKRKEVLARDRCECQTCGCIDEVMHVHHVEYFKGLEPWEADTDDLITLCEMCHDIVSDTARRLHERVGAMSLQLLATSQSSNFRGDVGMCLKTISNICIGAACQAG